jgi:hypothetical protein
MFQKLCFETCLTDVQDATDVEGFTYWRNDREKAAGRGTRIDYALCPLSWVNEKLLTKFKIREDTGLGSDHALLEFHLAGNLFSEEITIDHEDDRPNKEGVAAMVEDSVQSTVCEPADRLLQDIDNEDRVTIHDITSLAEPLTDEVVTAQPLGKLLKQDLRHSFDTVGWEQWNEILDEQEVNEQYDSLMTIEEASFTEKTYECIKEKHPYHAKRKPIILPTVVVTVQGQNCKTVRALGDTGASSSLIDKAFATLVLGEEELEQQLDTQGYCPTFKTADSRYTTPCGQLRLQFEIENQTFTHIFYVLEGCAEKIILGGCFF